MSQNQHGGEKKIILMFPYWLARASEEDSGFTTTKINFACVNPVDVMRKVKWKLDDFDLLVGR